VLIGGNFLNKHTTVPRWWYNTYNYYINATFFPWLEVGYLLTLHKAVPDDYGHVMGYWVPSTYGKFANQDRSFHIRLRLWKEGWWKPWTPQIVLSSNDAIGDSSHGGSLTGQSSQGYSNGFWQRYALAVTKHIDLKNYGRFGLHATWIYSDRFDNDLSDPAFGADFQPMLAEDGNMLKTVANHLKVMAEVVPGYTDTNRYHLFYHDQKKYQVNVGVAGSVYRDNINMHMELDKGRYFSCGVQFKIHLK
jgi:hypothetical protein